MKVLVINCGSSSLKYQVLDMTNEELLGKGLVDRIGIDGSVLKHQKVGADEKYVVEKPLKDHKDAISLVFDALTDPEHGVIADIKEIGAVGHRVVHAGEKYSASVLIDEDVIKALEECIDLAPLHNPANLLGIAACRDLLPGTPEVAVFDTAFHQTMPPEAYTYAIPYDYYKKYGVRRYGFHGTSHRFIAQRAAELLGRDIADTNIVTAHLGNGSSIAAVKGGKVVDTSMGLTPLAGVAMGTRSGDIDPAILQFISQKEGGSIDDITNILNKKSGVLGISGVSSDFRDIEDAAAEGNEQAELALDVFRHTVRSFIGAYFFELGGADAIVFTAGVGENDPLSRSIILGGLEGLGIKIDEEKNKARGKETVISTGDSKVKVYLIPTNEELAIARDTYTLAK
ncbi:MAG: acetate kinase [Clostridiales Family XIII bacterium]|jgi:acetate kinase|nr:acetate kinase [Clostridiales Family XIII bacterium]